MKSAFLLFISKSVCQRPLRPRANCQLSIVNYLGLGAIGQSQLPHSHRLFFRFMSFECFTRKGTGVLVKGLRMYSQGFLAAKHVRCYAPKQSKGFIYVFFFLFPLVGNFSYNNPMRPRCHSRVPKETSEAFRMG